LQDHRALVTLCVGLVVVETIVISALGPRGAVGLAPQVTAPEPIGIMHDLRWLAVFHRSWMAFAMEALAFVAFRTTLVIVLIRLAWDPRQPTPSLRQLATWTLRYVVIVAVLSFAWIAVMFGLAVVALDWLFFVGVPSLFLVALVTHHGILRPVWWRESPQLRTTAWLVLTLVELSAAGAVIAALPFVLRVPVAILAGGFNAWAWMMIVEHLTAPRSAPRFRPVGPAAIALLVTATLVGVAIGAPQLQHPATSPAVTAAGLPVATIGSATGLAPGPGPAVLVATGFDSTWDGTEGAPLTSGLVQQRFSYRGLGADDKPLPYDAGATHRSVAALVRTMRDQVNELHRRTGRRVAVVAESEGSIIAAAYLVSHERAPVSNLVLLSPLVRPGRVYYPPAGEDGWGVATGWALRGITNIVGEVSSINLPADAPFLRSITSHPLAFRDLLACTPPHIPKLVIVPITSALSSPDPVAIAGPTLVLPAVHGGLLGNPTARAATVRAIRGRPPSGESWDDVESVLRAATAPWQVPELPLSVNPAWRSGTAPPSPSGSRCARTVAAARAWLG
jgi:hypothetical protein